MSYIVFVIVHELLTNIMSTTHYAGMIIMYVNTVSPVLYLFNLSCRLSSIHSRPVTPDLLNSAIKP